MSILNILQLLSIDGVRKGGNENLEGVQEDKEVKKFYKKWKFWIIFIFIVLFLFGKFVVLQRDVLGLIFGIFCLKFFNYYFRA